MSTYIPIEEVQLDEFDVENSQGNVPRFRVQLSRTELSFSDKNNTAEIVVTNTGWDTLRLREVVQFGENFTYDHDIGAVLLPKMQATVTITSTAGSFGDPISGGLYFDFGDCYGKGILKVSTI